VGYPYARSEKKLLLRREKGFPPANLAQPSKEYTIPEAIEKQVIPIGTIPLGARQDHKVL
jgi:hypothetical protein